MHFGNQAEAVRADIEQEIAARGEGTLIPVRDRCSRGMGLSGTAIVEPVLVQCGAVFDRKVDRLAIDLKYRIALGDLDFLSPDEIGYF